MLVAFSDAAEALPTWTRLQNQSLGEVHHTSA